MGVTVLQQFPMTENRTGPQTIEFLAKRIIALGAVQAGSFLVDCETYTAVPQLGEDLRINVRLMLNASVYFTIIYRGAKAKCQ